MCEKLGRDVGCAGFMVACSRPHKRVLALNVRRNAPRIHSSISIAGGFVVRGRRNFVRQRPLSIVGSWHTRQKRDPSPMARCAIRQMPLRAQSHLVLGQRDAKATSGPSSGWRCRRRAKTAQIRVEKQSYSCSKPRRLNVTA